MKEKSTQLSFDNSEYASILFGALNSHVEFMADLTGAAISSFGNDLLIKTNDKKISNADLQIIANVFTQCYSLVKEGHIVKPENFEQAYNLLKEEPHANVHDTFNDYTIIKSPKKTIIARNASQKNYIECMKNNEIVFGIGPAGTGKTYLAVAMALQYLMTKRVKRIILTRPAVEAGEKLGFLPGNMNDKVDPYLRPLFDALDEMLGRSQSIARQEAGMIEIAPLAFMRGRTLSDSFLILDEAQNTTPEQMKMFLTRMGFGSRMIITGDVTQIDLPPVVLYNEKYDGKWAPRAVRSGLVESLSVLKNTQGVGIYNFNNADVVRHPMVNRIVNAYDAHKTN